MVDYFDKIYIIAIPEQKKKIDRIVFSLKYFYPDCDPIVFEAVNTRHKKNKWNLNNHHIGCALSHRNVIQDARNNGYKKILVFEEDAILHKKFDYYIQEAIKEMKSVDWDMVKLGGHNWNLKFEKVKGCQVLEIDNQTTSTQSYAANESIYDEILNNIPDSVPEVEKWGHAIDQWYLNEFGRGRNKKRKYNYFITSPHICSQDPLLGVDRHKNPDFREDFLLPEELHTR